MYSLELRLKSFTVLSDTVCKGVIQEVLYFSKPDCVVQIKKNMLININL